MNDEITPSTPLIVAPPPERPPMLPEPSPDDVPELSSLPDPMAQTTSKKMDRFRRKEYAADKRRAPDDGVVQVDSKSAIVAARTLGLNGKQWGVRGIRAREQLGKYLNQPLRLRPLMAVNTMNTLEQLDAAMEAVVKLSRGETVVPQDAGKEVIIRAEDRVKAGQAASMIAEAHVKLSEHLLKLAESANPKSDNGANGNIPLNKPPSFATEVTAPDGTTVRTVASSGGQ